jgi:hypothetical protein
MIAMARIAFTRIAVAALGNAETIVRRWLPDGRPEGREWVARNPTRNDQRLGSFKVNVARGFWSDFATGERGGDLISLAAYLHGLKQSEAAMRLAEMLGVNAYE